MPAQSERKLTVHQMTMLEVSAGAKVFKLSDSFTAGIPDVVATLNGRTWWDEVKYVRPKSSLRAECHCEKSIGIQLETLCALEAASLGRACVVAYCDGKRGQSFTQIWRPSALRAKFEAGESRPEAATLVLGGVRGLFDLFTKQGSIFSPGYAHAIVAGLVLDGSR